MFNLLSIIAIGFVLGMRHATDPDHVVAVTTIVTNQRKISRSALVGAMWGLGHTFTILIVGTAIILFNLVIPVRLGLGMELSVSVMLILLGVWNLASFTRGVPDAPLVHSHGHAHGDHLHSHVHVHQTAAHVHAERTGLDRTLGKVAGYQLLRPLLVGIIHGLAGSAAVALLILATIRNPRWAIIYLLVFGIGTIAGMMLITMSIASALHYVGNRFARLSSGLRIASGLVSVGFGTFLAYEICVIQGFFGAHPTWTPH
jgi:ABC-type nickel/cobalt efflux system permease component RcnA